MQMDKNWRLKLNKNGAPPYLICLFPISISTGQKNSCSNGGLQGARRNVGCSIVHSFKLMTELLANSGGCHLRARVRADVVVQKTDHR